VTSAHTTGLAYEGEEAEGNGGGIKSAKLDHEKREEEEEESRFKNHNFSGDA
jgi:hypothetical protein